MARRLHVKIRAILQRHFVRRARRGRQEEIKVLIATDILAEGLNLQDADRLINYDLHWNPVRLMQRIGRVDRRVNPDIEMALLAAHPHLASTRGSIIYWNFLPPDELDDLLRLYSRVNNKALIISRTFGIEGRKLLHPDDEFDPVKEINEQYEGQESETEALRLEYEQLLRDHPDLAAQLPGLPLTTFSGNKTPKKGVRAVFFCFRVPRPDPDLIETADGAARWSESAGETIWVCTDPDGKTFANTPRTIADLIRSLPETPIHHSLDRSDLSKLREKIEKNLIKSHLRPCRRPSGCLRS